MDENDANDEELDHHNSNVLISENDFYSSPVPAYAEIRSCNVNNETIINCCSKPHTHRHSSRCFTAEVFLHGIKFILKKRVHSASPNIQNIKRIESVSSTDDGFLDGGPLLHWSIGSDRVIATSSGASSEGFQDSERPIKSDSYLDKVLLNLRANIRSSICDNCVSLPILSTSFYRSLENILVFFQNRYHSCQWLSTSAAQLNEAELIEAGRELKKVYQSMFSEKIDWGRIVAMIGFVGELSVCALSADRLELIEEYVSASVVFVQEHIMTWITEKGGWEGLVDYKPVQNFENADLDSMFGSLSRLAGVAALALAGVVICKFVSDHI